MIGGLKVISNLGQMGWYHGAWFWAILLIAGGVWFYRQDTYGPRSPQDPAPDRPFDPTVTGGTATSAATAVQPGYVARPAPRVRPIR